MISKFIGNTPLRRCDALSTRYHTNIFIKEEFHNPGMSAKDRPALFMIKDAIAKNKIKPGGIFVEASSGNTGLGITLIAKKLGYRAKIFISQSCSQEKINLLIKAGADIEICENSNGLHDFNSTQFKAQSFAAIHPNAYFTNQYYNNQNIRAHYQTTAPEIWEQTVGNITHFIAGVGTGGTISGVGRFLKEQRSDIKVWGIEPKGSILSHFLKHRTLPTSMIPFDAIEGIGRNFVPGSFDATYVDHIFQVNCQKTKHIAKEYYSQTGIMAGFSSAAVMASLDCYIDKMSFIPTDTVVLFFPDHGDRYISKLYNGSVYPANISSNITSF
ncbi:cysteine synthase family protein [Sphingobacterium sp. DN00404]|uniref:Cysteine synthase family protein n=1 Tax=Sphingobacterium micropteri TaxID=2763501 RepID=A0ABR7YNV0_9SPHI|nr:cysteine synthase family protein [Sphingobacterium micropteri]MBD1432986.1 cysteine synthase family protein [Sphingobacterium micropteri]